MGAYLISAAIGAVIGAIYGAGAIVGMFDVRSREKAAKEQRNSETWHTLAFLATAQNARLRVSIAEGGLTEEGKKIAAMTMAAVDAVTTSEANAIVTELAKPVQNLA